MEEVFHRWRKPYVNCLEPKISRSRLREVFRALGLEYLDRTDIVQVPPAEIRAQDSGCNCGEGGCRCGEKNKEISQPAPVDKHYGTKYNKAKTEECHLFIENSIPNGAERVDRKSVV